jgi:ADP-ribose pyrophosphatase YjhB (NUDIX family)
MGGEAVTGERGAPTIRVGGFIVRDGRLLLAEQRRRAERSGPSYWLLPGGGVRCGETLSEALQREGREELGVDLAPGRPIALAESISPDPSYPKHILHVILTAVLSPDIDVTSLSPTDAAVLSLRFFAAGELQQLAIRPPLAAHLARYMDALPLDVEYLGRVW